MAAAAALAALVLTPVSILIDELAIDFAGWMPGVPLVVSSGVIPTAILIGMLTAFYVLMKRRYRPEKVELVQALFVFLLVGFIVLTAVGLWFRGEGMALSWPWGV
jgi:hypothetical protein